MTHHPINHGIKIPISPYETVTGLHDHSEIAKSKLAKDARPIAIFVRNQSQFVIINIDLSPSKQHMLDFKGRYCTSPIDSLMEVGTWGSHLMLTAFFACSLHRRIFDEYQVDKHRLMVRVYRKWTRILTWGVSYAYALIKCFPRSPCMSKVQLVARSHLIFFILNRRIPLSKWAFGKTKS